MDIQLLIAFGVYFFILLLIGVLSHRKQTSSAEFIVGNRSLNFWLTALSAHASDMSNWLFMAYPAAILMGGLSQSWIAISLILGMFVNWQFVAKRLRTDTEKYNSYTLSTYFEKRLGDASGSVRFLTAIMTIFFLTSYLSAGLIGMGLFFESVFGIDYYVGLTIAVFVIGAYTFYGGFVTVAWTDLFQALFLLFCIILVPLVVFAQLPNGFADIQAVAESRGISLSFTNENILEILFLMVWGFGYWGQPHILTKFMGIKSPNEMNKAKYVGMSWLILSLTAATFIGLVGMAFFSQGSLANPQLVFIEAVKSLFHPLPAGFILCAVLAATMSTMDSQVLVCASVFSEDLYKRFLHRSASEWEKVLVSRIGVVLIALTALLLAFTRSNSVMEAVQYAWNGLGSSFGPLLLMCLYSKRITRLAGIVGIVVGGVVAATWHMINPCMTTACVPSMLPGFFTSLASIWLVSRWETYDLKRVQLNL